MHQDKHLPIHVTSRRDVFRYVFFFSLKPHAMSFSFCFPVAQCLASPLLWKRMTTWRLLDYGKSLWLHQPPSAAWRRAAAAATAVQCSPRTSTLYPSLARSWKHLKVPLGELFDVKRSGNKYHSSSWCQYFVSSYLPMICISIQHHMVWG